MTDRGDEAENPAASQPSGQRPTWTVQTPGVTLAAFVRERTGVSWSAAKRQVTTGKLLVDGRTVRDVAHRLQAGDRVELHPNAPRAGKTEVSAVLVFDDAHVVVLDKPAGIMSVPYSDEDRDTAMDLVRSAWRAQRKPATTPLHVVHRIDRATSGLLMFAKSKPAEQGLAAQLRKHDVQRRYTCVVHGTIDGPRRIESRLVADRGDGLRGSTRHKSKGKRAVTHVEPRQGLRGATLCEVQLETGKTHQIRIHLAEAGHPLVGETVYIRDFLRAGHEPLRASRLLLHASTLGFEHPVDHKRLEFTSALPDDFEADLQQLR